MAVFYYLPQKNIPVDILVLTGILTSTKKNLMLYSANRVGFLEEQKLKRRFQQKDLRLEETWRQV